MLTGEKMCRPWRRATLKCILKVNMGIFGTYQETEEIHEISKFHTLRHILGLRDSLAHKVLAVLHLCKSQLQWYMSDFHMSLQAIPGDPRANLPASL